MEPPVKYCKVDNHHFRTYGGRTQNAMQVAGKKAVKTISSNLNHPQLNNLKSISNYDDRTASDTGEAAVSAPPMKTLSINCARAAVSVKTAEGRTVNSELGNPFIVKTAGDSVELTLCLDKNTYFLTKSSLAQKKSRIILPSFPGRKVETNDITTPQCGNANQDLSNVGGVVSSPKIAQPVRTMVEHKDGEPVPVTLSFPEIPEHTETMDEQISSEQASVSYPVTPERLDSAADEPVDARTNGSLLGRDGIRRISYDRLLTGIDAILGNRKFDKEIANSVTALQKDLVMGTRMKNSRNIINFRVDKSKTLKTLLANYVVHNDEVTFDISSDSDGSDDVRHSPIHDVINSESEDDERCLQISEQRIDDFPLDDETQKVTREKLFSDENTQKSLKKTCDALLKDLQLLSSDSDQLDIPVKTVLSAANLIKNYLSGRGKLTDEITTNLSNIISIIKS